MYSPPGRPLEKRELGLFQFHLLSLSRWSPHLPQCQSTSVSVALVSTLATVSVHFCLCRLGLHTCHSVSPLLSLSPWSPHLPQCQSTSVSVALVSTLATVSVSPRLSLSPWSPLLPHCQSTSVSVALVSTLATVSVHFCLCRVGLHTCHSVSPLLCVALVSTLATVSVHSVLKCLSHCLCGYTNSTTE